MLNIKTRRATSLLLVFSLVLSMFAGMLQTSNKTYANADTAAPVFINASLSWDMISASLLFNEPIEADPAALKAGLSLAVDGTRFLPLIVNDSVVIDGERVVITFSQSLTGDANRIKLASGILKDTSGNIVQSDVVSGALKGDMTKLRLPPSDDVHAQDGTQKSTNFNDKNFVYVKEDSNNNFDRIGFIKFQLDSISPERMQLLDTAVFRFHLNKIDSGGGAIHFHEIANDTWQEGTLTFQSKPVLTSPGFASVNVSALQYYEVDVTSYIRSQFADKSASLGVTVPLGKGFQFFSKENPENRPELLLSFNDDTPVFNGVEISDQNRSIKLAYTYPILNHTADLASMKAGIQLSSDEGVFMPLGVSDQVMIQDKNLIVTLQNRLTSATSKLKILGNTLKSISGTPLENDFELALTPDVLAPFIQNVVLGSNDRDLTVWFNEPVMQVAPDPTTLKASIQFARNGTDYSPLGAQDVVAIVDGKVVVTLTTALDGPGSRLKLEGNMFMDAAGNVNSELISPPIQMLPSHVITSSRVAAGNRVIRLMFNLPIINHSGSLDELKQKIKISTDGVSFGSLKPGDTVELQGMELKLTLADVLRGVSNYILIEAGAFRTEAGKVLPHDLTSNPIAAEAPELMRELAAAADAYVDGANPNTAYGGGGSLMLYSYNTSAANNMNPILRFNLMEVGSFTTAKLRLNCSQSCASGNVAKLYAVTDDGWDEATVTWNTKPAHGALISQTVIGGASGWFEWDVTDYVKGQDAEDGIVSFYMTGGSSKIKFASKEATGGFPHLLLHTDTTAPVFMGSEVSGENRVIRLLFDEPIFNHHASLDQLKQAITVAANGNVYEALSASSVVSIQDKALILSLDSTVQSHSFRVKLAGGSLKDKEGNLLVGELVTPSLLVDLASPEFVRAGISDFNRRISLEFTEQILAAGLMADLKNAITYSVDGGSYSSLTGSDSIQISEGKLVIQLVNALSGTNNWFRLAPEAVKDLAGNLLTSEVHVQVAADLQPPVLQAASTSTYNQRVILAFNELVYSTGDAASLRSSVTISRNGIGFEPLLSSETVAVMNEKLILSLDEGLVGSSIVRISGGALKDAFGNVQNAEVQSPVILPAATSYPYPKLSGALLEKALKMDMTFHRNPRGNNTTNPKLFAALSTELAAGSRDEQAVEKFVDVVKKLITDPTRMPDMHGGLGARNHFHVLYGLALVWNLPDIMDHFTDEEKSKLRNLAKAGLISSVYVLTDKNANGSSRVGSTGRLAMDRDTNTWPHSAPNYSEPILGQMYAASFMLGMHNVRSILDTYNHTAFIAELDAQGLTEIRDTFAMTLPEEVEPVLKSPHWSFKGVTMEQYLRDPFLLFKASEEFTFPHKAQDGDFMGQDGMLKEFDTTDGKGPRQDAVYSIHGGEPALQNRILFEMYGYLDTAASQHEVARVKELQKVGLNDYYAKTVNGYYATSLSHNGNTQYPEHGFVWDLAVSMGLIQPATWNDTFNYDPTGLDPLNNLSLNWVTAGGAWTPVYEPIIPYNIKTQVNTSSSIGLVSPTERSLKAEGAGTAYTATKTYEDVRYQAWIQFESASKAGLIGRVQNEANYYFLGYDMVDRKLFIRKVANGQSVVLAEKTALLETGKSYRFKGVFIGNKIELHLNGVEQVSVQDTSFATGAIGFAVIGGSTKFDGVIVQQSSPQVPELSEIVVGENQLTLKYNQVADAMSYRIYYGTEPGVYTQSVESRFHNQFTVGGLLNDVRYYFAIASITPYGESGKSNEMSFIPRVNTTVVPVITGLVAKGDKVTVHFTQDQANEWYTIRYGTQPGVYNMEIQGVSHSGYTLDLPPFGQQTYYVVVSAKNETGTSVESESASVTTPGPILYQDNFNNATTLTYWKSLSGFTHASGALQSRSNGTSRAYLNAGYNWTDYRVSTTFSYTDPLQEAYVLGRVLDDNNYYSLGYKSNTLVITKKLNGTISTLASIPYSPLISGMVYKLEGEFEGSRLALYLNGELMLETQDSSLLFGTGGLLGFRTLGIFDDFMVRTLGPEPDSNADLKSILVGGQPLTDFLPHVLGYTMTLPAGTTIIPSVTAVTYSVYASYSVISALTLPGMTTIEVTAENGSVKSYHLSMNLENAPTAVLDSNSSLKALMVNGVPLAGFTPSKLNYAVLLPTSTTIVPTVTAVTYSVYAVHTVTPAAGLPGVTNIKVTAQDGTKKTYMLAFTIQEPESHPPSSPSDPIPQPSFAMPSNRGVKLGKEAFEQISSGAPAIVKREAISNALELLKESKLPRRMLELSMPMGFDALVIPAAPFVEQEEKTKDAILSVQTETASLDIPYRILDTKGISSKMRVKETDISFKFVIQKASEEQRLLLNSKVLAAGSKLVDAPTRLTLTATAGNLELEISSFKGQHVMRKIVADVRLDAKQTTVLLHDEATGGMRFVPATFEVIGSQTWITVMTPENGIFAVVQGDKSFLDLKNHWAKQDVEHMAAKWLVNGTSEDSFQPERAISRAEAAALMIRALGITTASEDESPIKLGDLSTQDWHYHEVSLALSYGFVKGYQDGTFKPDVAVTREELAVLIGRVLEHRGLMSITAPLDRSREFERFADKDVISPWAKEAVAHASARNLMKGKGNGQFAPADVATRAEAAVMIKRLLLDINLIN